MVLHQTWVADAVVGSRDSNAAARFLDDCCEDEAVVNSSLSGHGFDCVPDGADLGTGVIVDTPGRAGREHNCFVGIEPGYVRLGILRVIGGGLTSQ